MIPRIDEKIAERDELLERLYLVASEKTDDDALDLIFHQMDDWVDDQHYAMCTQVMAHVDLGKLSCAVMLGFLSTTCSVKHLISGREEYCKRIESWMIESGDSLEVVDDILGRLR